MTGATTFDCILTGLGNRGLHWLRHLRERDDCRIVAYVEPAEPNRARAISQHDVPGTRIFATLESVLDRVEADFVLDVTPPAVHHQVAELALERGLHVLGEKPLSNDFGRARRVVDAGRANRRKHMVTQQYRFSSQPRTTRQKLDEGLIGRPGQCDVRFYMPWADIPGSHYVTEPYMLLNDMMVHHFDMMRYVLGADPISVQAITWNHPWGWHHGDAAHAIVFRFSGGLVATHVSCGCALGSQTTWNGDWRIEGPEGAIDWERDRMWYSRLHRVPEPIREEIPLLPVPASEQSILSEFFAAIREDRQPECSARDNLRSLAMVFAAIRSAQENRRVELAELE